MYYNSVTHLNLSSSLASPQFEIFFAGWTEHVTCKESTVK